MPQESKKDNYTGVFDGRIGFGKKAAVLVVDFVNAYTTPGAALYAPAVVDAVRETVDVLDVARRNDILVVYTRVQYSANGLDGGIFVQKVPVLRTMVEGEPLTDIVPELPPAPEDIVITKQYASAFFGIHFHLPKKDWGGRGSHQRTRCDARGARPAPPDCQARNARPREFPGSPASIPMTHLETTEQRLPRETFCWQSALGPAP